MTRSLYYVKEMRITAATIQFKIAKQNSFGF